MNQFKLAIGGLFGKGIPLDVNQDQRVMEHLQALGYAQELGVSFDEGLLKDRYSKKGPLRSFIEPHQSDRIEINRWIIPIKEIIDGKHVVVIDDSLVRGPSSKAIIKA